ncbi:MAG: Branched-chain amino acid transport system permease protein LivM, partial [uncultured Acetobacteraceae bacterium]
DPRRRAARRRPRGARRLRPLRPAGRPPHGRLAHRRAVPTHALDRRGDRLRHRLPRAPRPHAVARPARPAPHHRARPLDRAAGTRWNLRRACAPRRRGGAAVHPRHRPLRTRHRHPGAHLRDARMGPEHRGRPRRAARPRLRRLLRDRRLLLRAAGAVFRPVLLGVPAAGRHPGRLLGRPARLPGAAAQGRLPRHRHARLRRDHPRRAHQLGEPDGRAQRDRRHPAPVLLRPAFLHGGRPRHLRRLLRAGAVAHAPRHLPLLPHPRAGAADQLGDDTPPPPAPRPRLGSPARGRDRLPRAGHQRHRHEAFRLRAGRHVRRLRRGLLRHPPGLHQPGELHLHRERHHPRHRRARRPRQPGRRGDRGAGDDRRLRTVPRPRRVADAGVRRRHGGHHGVAAAGPGRHPHAHRRPRAEARHQRRPGERGPRV